MPLTPELQAALWETKRRRRDAEFVRRYGDAHPEALPDDIECLRNPFLGTCLYVWCGMQFKSRQDAMDARAEYHRTVAAKQVRCGG